MTERCDAAIVLTEALTAGDRGTALGVLGAHAGFLVQTGYARIVVAAGAQFPEVLTDPEIAAAVATARHLTGDWHRAEQDFQQLVSGGESADPELGWRAAQAAYLSGEIDRAHAVLSGGRTNCDLGLNATWHAWAAAVQAARGDCEAACELADRAVRLAGEAEDLLSVAVCHATVSELAAGTGDWRAHAAHHRLAVEAAERAADVPSRIRLAIARGTYLGSQARVSEATTILEDALELIDETGYRVFRPQALCEMGTVHLRCGRIEDALKNYADSRDGYQAMNSRGVAWPLVGLGDIYRLQGQVTRARAAYEEAVHHAEAGGDRRCLQLARAGLARVRAADDLVAAAALAEEAMSNGRSGAGQLEALLAGGWIALLSGESGKASSFARRASDVARRRRDHSGLAEALELTACARPEAAGTELSEALAIRTDAGDSFGAARARLLTATLRGDRSAASNEATTLRRLGVRRDWTGMADAMALVRLAPALRIEALGRFQVIREGSTVAATEWQSKKARDVLKILLSRRGGPITRDELHALLWPDDAHLASNRLSVVLTVLRTVLDGSRVDRISNPAIVSDRNVIRLDLSVVDVDVERYVEVATAALDSWRRRDAGALRSLQTAVAAYTGGFCAEDVYESWAQPTRDELAALHASVVRALGAAARSVGDVDLAVWSYLTLIRQDPYDESAYVDLVTTLHESGRYGEARRQYRRYAEHMDEIDVEPAPFPGSAEPSYPARVVS